MQSILQKSAQFRKEKFIILDYMKDRSIQKSVQTKVLKYLEYIHH